MFINRGVNKDVVCVYAHTHTHTHKEYYSAIRKDEIITFTAIHMDLEIAKLN